MHVKGGYKFALTSDNQNVDFTRVRFEITDGAEFSLNLAAGDFVSTATFTGVTGQVSFEVHSRGNEQRGCTSAPISIGKVRSSASSSPREAT